MDEDELIDSIIRELGEKQWADLSSYVSTYGQNGVINLNMLKVNEYNISPAHVLIEKIELKGLIQKLGSEKHELTDWGKKIYHSGGWLKHVKDQRKAKGWFRFSAYEAATIILGVLSVFLLFQTNNQGNTTNKIEQRMKELEQRQEKSYLQIDSLRRSLDKIQKSDSLK